MKIVNLTKNIVRFISDNGNVIKEIPPSGRTVKVDVKTQIIGQVDDIPVTDNIYSRLVGLPEPQKDTIYIVPKIVAQACDRTDVFAPNQAIKSDGEIIGCKSLTLCENKPIGELN